jgi:hypothetical protein
MGYATVKVIFDVSADDLHAHFERHAALYVPRSKDADDFHVEIIAGQHCSAIWSNDQACPDMFLYPIGHQLAALWMDVRYQDGDAWDLSCYSAFKNELNHSVNPWAYDPEFRYDTRADKAIKYRIDKLCKLLPQFAAAIPPYMLLWRYPKDLTNPGKLVDRKGKARDNDRFEYGDAYQYHDFLSCFGINVDKPVHKIKVHI